MNYLFKAKGLRFSLFFLCIFVLISAGRGAEVASEVKPLIGPPSAWVKPQFSDRQAVVMRPQDRLDQHWLLYEREINAATNETFFHFARQFLSLNGVQNGSTLKIAFDPSYQTLTIHWIRLWRGTNHLDRLAADKIRMMRQESELDQALLTGEQTAVVVLADVRPGDILDYAYSIKGANPVFDGKFSGEARGQLSEPIERILTRVLWPAQRRLYPKTFNCTVQPAVTTKDGLIELVWDLRHVPAYHQEDATPTWFDPQPWVQLSEFNSWAEVSQWAFALFKKSSPLSPELTQKIKEWSGLPDNEQKILAALRFVQDQIRYFGIEIDASAERPTDPSTVFARRFGDCKDKSLLFVTLLRGLGIEAYPVLVNTEARQTIATWLPAADAFDHCIAVVRSDHQTWWLDPTAGYQRGPLRAHYLPNYGFGLVISPRTTSLTPIPQNAGMPLTTTTEYFNLGRKTGGTDLKVVTVAEGRDADRLREIFATTKRDDIEKSDTGFYADSYTGTQMAAPLEIRDDETWNRFETSEFYKIDKAWIRSDDREGKVRCDFYPFTMAALTKKPLDTQRKFPLAVLYPEHQILRTEISVHVKWTYKAESFQVNDPAFVFRKQSRRVGNKLVLEYEYQSLMDFVPAYRVQEYFQNLDRVSKCLGDRFVWK